MRKYLIGFMVGLATMTTLAFAVDYSDIDWYGAHRDYGFKKAVMKIIENCKTDGTEISC